MTLEATGTVSYGTFTFPAAFKSKVSAEPVYDDQGQGVKYHRYTITIDFFVTGEDVDANYLDARDGIDPAIRSLRLLLQKPRQTFTFSGHGMGDNFIHTPTTDMEFGPKPKIIAWEDIGAGRAVHIVWQVVVAATQCQDHFLTNPPARISAFGYTVVFGHSENGLMTRTVNGYGEVPVKIAANERGIDRDADFLREVIRFPPLAGFHRTQNWTLSNDRRRIDFTITDTEIASPNPYPYGAVRVQMRHRLRRAKMAYNDNKLQAATVPWQFSLSGSVEVRPGVNKAWAWAAFAHVVRNRLSYARYAVMDNGKPAGLYALLDMDIDENVYGYDVAFNLNYGLISNLRSLMRASGFFRPVPSSVGSGTWENWTMSMGEIFTPTGRYPNINHLPSDDTIVTLCSPTGSGNGLVTGSNNGMLPGKNSENESAPRYKPPEPYLQDSNITPSTSWLDLKMEFRLIHKSTTLTHHKLGIYDSTGPVDFTLTPPNHSQGTIHAATSDSLSSRNGDGIVVHQRGPGQWYLVMLGSVARIRYPIAGSDIPYVARIGNADAVRKSAKFIGPKVVRRTPSGPVFQASWAYTYHVPFITNSTFTVQRIPATVGEEQDKQ